MNRKNLLPLLFTALLGLSLSHPTHELVKFVYDGDTILLKTGEKVRYLAIDAPEIGYEGKKSEFMAGASREYNLRLVAKKRVSLEFDKEKRDRHGRLLAYVFLENGEMVNALMLRHGFARVMVKGPDLKYFSRLLSEQRHAMAEKRGIWSQDTANGERFYLGSSKSYRFHRPGCAFAEQIRPSHLVRFQNRQKAFWEGFNPCKRCSP